MFGVALTVVLVAGAELATSAMMILTQGALRGAVGWGRAGRDAPRLPGGNLLGAMLFAFLVHVSGVVAPGTPGGTVLAGMIEHKADATSMQLFTRGILCNLLVCLAVWSAARLRSEGARLVVVFGCVMVFITSGFEHVVANMTTFSLGLYGGLPGADVIEMAQEPHARRPRQPRRRRPPRRRRVRVRRHGRHQRKTDEDESGSGALPGDREPLAIR